MTERRCVWCGGVCSLSSSSCASCADLEWALRAYERLPAQATQAERELRELEAELQRLGDDA